MTFGLSTTERNLILTGYIEPNKPRIGRQVAEQLHMPFVDIEEQIEQRIGENVGTIRENFGERRLKTVEDDVIAELVLHRRTVIRVNGSTLVHSENVERLQETGHIFVLVARLDAILQRMHVTLGARYHDPAERAQAVGELQREWLIRKFPGVHEIDATYDSESAIVSKVLELWRQVGIERI